LPINKIARNSHDDPHQGNRGLAVGDNSGFPRKP